MVSVSPESNGRRSKSKSDESTSSDTESSEDSEEDSVSEDDSGGENSEEGESNCTISNSSYITSSHNYYSNCSIFLRSRKFIQLLQVCTTVPHLSLIRLTHSNRIAI